MFYNIRGHKIKMNDQDMGVWKYKHNFRGELIHQWDANHPKSSNCYCPNSHETSG